LKAKRNNNAANIDNIIRSISSASLVELMSIWRARDAKQWSQSPDSYRLIAEKILQQGEPLLAFDVVTEGLSILPDDVRLRQLQGLALARSGATERANAILESLRRDGQTDEETLGMLGRTYKDLAAHAATKLEREKFLRRAAETYAQAYQSSGGYWTGINAATMNLLIGEKERACEIAKMVRAQCLKEVQDPGGDQYWELAALGEAALICRDLSQAEEWYARAAKEAAHRFGDIHSSRRNARLILQHWNEDSSKIDKYLHVPSVIVFAGHMIDRPDRKLRDFRVNSNRRWRKKFAARSRSCNRDSVSLRRLAVRTFFFWKRCSTPASRSRWCCRTAGKNLFAIALTLFPVPIGVSVSIVCSSGRRGSSQLRRKNWRSAVFPMSFAMSCYSVWPRSALASLMPRSFLSRFGTVWPVMVLAARQVWFEFGAVLGMSRRLSILRRFVGEAVRFPRDDSVVPYRSVIILSKRRFNLLLRVLSQCFLPTRSASAS